jgi:outer membrane protein assembly factor BamB
MASSTPSGFGGRKGFDVKPSPAATLLAAALAGSAALAAQEWTTSGLDAQRTSWVRGDDRLTPASVADGTFRFLWKHSFENVSRGLNSLTPPVLLDRLIGYRGFKTLAFVGGSSNRVFAIDTDLNRPYWMVQLNYMAATGGPPPVTPECPGGLTATPGRRTPLLVPALGRRGGARGGSTSAVGEPGRGAAIMSQPPRGRGPARQAGPAPARGGRARGVPAIPFGGVDPVYVVGYDGFLHVLRASDGADAAPAMPFLPPGARASAVVFVDGIVYTTSSKGCGVSPNGVWAIDLTTPEYDVTSWSTGGPDIAGPHGLAFGADGTIFVATGPAPGGVLRASAESARRFANAVVALDGATLAVKDWFSADAAFNTSPTVIRHGNRDLVAITADDGRLYLLDGSSLGGVDHRTPLHVTARFSDAGADGALATWDAQGTRWLLAPAVGSPKPGVTFAGNGPAGAGRIVAFRLVESGGTVTLEPGWASRAMPAPLGPIVVNGVVFAAASGEYRGAAGIGAAERIKRSTRAVLYALDGSSGKELWTSGTTIASFAQEGLAAGGGQVYVVTEDSAMYAFGVPMER